MRQGGKRIHKHCIKRVNYDMSKIADYIKDHPGIKPAEYCRWLRMQGIKTGLEGVLAALETNGHLLSEEIKDGKNRLYYFKYRSPNEKLI